VRVDRSCLKTAPPNFLAPLKVDGPSEFARRCVEALGADQGVACDKLGRIWSHHLAPGDFVTWDTFTRSAIAWQEGARRSCAATSAND